MKNRGKKKIFSSVALFEILLLVSMVFAIAFTLSEGVAFVSAGGGNGGGKDETTDTGTGGGNWLLDLITWGRNKISSLFMPSNAAPAPSKNATGIFAGIKKVFSGEAMGGGVAGTLIAGVAWAGIVYGGVKIIGSLFGAKKSTVNALAQSASAGVFAYKTISLLATKTSVFGSYGSTLATAAPFIGLGVAAAVFVLTYKKEKKKIVTFECLPWEAPIGGKNCEDCNKDPFRPCSEYRCRSLGQACQLLNPGTSEEKCTWVSPKDVKSPIITPSEPLTKGLRYVPDNAVRPPALGTKIVREEASDGCLKAFTPLEFSIATGEPSQCKIDYVHTSSFDNMTYYFGEDNYFTYNHTQRMKLPGLDTGEKGDLSPVIENDGTYSLYVRCKDANGNENVDEYSFSFCVEKGPDTTPPIIDGTSIIDGSPVQYNADTIPIEVYVNEPAECKWSRQDKAYDDMENPMNCATETYQINANLDYTCSGNLTGIKNLEDNKFYFRCKDRPGKEDSGRNVNSQSFPLTLRGTQALNIIKSEPNGTIYGSTSVVTTELGLETSNGADEGKAKCYFSPTGDIDSFIPMFETDNYVHKQTLDLGAGDYTYYFRCIDDGGNADNSSVSFKVFVDKSAPKITRIYKENDALKIITNEDAECVYSLNDCNYNMEEGIKFIYPDSEKKTSEFAEWKPSVIYYIKCKDAYENMPLSNFCTMKASATDIK